MQSNTTMEILNRDDLGSAAKGKHSLVRERQIDFRFLMVASKKPENACEYSNGFRGDFSLNRTGLKAQKRDFSNEGASTYAYSYNPSFSIHSNSSFSW